MTPEELDLTLFQLKKYFSSKDMMNLSSILKNLPSSTTSRIHMMSFKNPNTAPITIAQNITNSFIHIYAH